MKQLITVIACMLFAVSMQAQITTFSHTATNPNGTVTNTSTDTMTAKLPGYSEVTGIQLAVTKTSGTVAGIARLYGSIDGTNFIATGDTLTLTNVAVNTVIWKVSLPVYVDYRILTTGSGTMVATAQAKAVMRKP